jgi:hypothetical protein
MNESEPGQISAARDLLVLDTGEREKVQGNLAWGERGNVVANNQKKDLYPDRVGVDAGRGGHRVYGEK